MARKVSKRKRPSKYDYLLKERWELEDAVFDRYVLITLYRFMKKGLIKSVDFPISRGKEANLYRATAPDGTPLAVKIYRIETTKFFKKMKYIVGDPRFTKVKKDRKNLAFAFAKKEFKNLMLCSKIGINVPKPLACRRNVLLMEFLGKDTEVYPQLYRIKSKKVYLKKILKQVKSMYENNLVHSDLSPYNILIGDKVYIIDLGQGVYKGHPMFEKFLERDVKNVLSYFKKRKDTKKTLGWIKK